MKWRLLLCFITFAQEIWAQDLATIAEQKPITFSGNLSAQYTFYNTTGNAYMEPGSWTISGSPVLSIYGVVLPFNFTISEKERSFRQPFNQFGLSPYYKWATLHLGYRNIQFSEYSLAGHQMLGAGAEIKHPSKISVGVMYGRLLRAVNPKQPETASYFQTPAYSRKGLALKGGYGDEKNNVNVFYLSASDEAGSLSNIPDSLLLKAYDNRVVGANTRHVFLKNFLAELEFAVSETGSKLPDEATEVTEKGNVVDFKTGYNKNNLRVMLKYLRIEPGFESLGKYFFQRDVRNITIDPGMDFFQKKLSVDFSAGFQRDHLDNNKSFKTERNILSGKVTARPWKFYLINVSIGNYSIEQSAGLYEPDPAFRVSQVTFNATVMNQFNLVTGKVAHSLNLLYSGQTLSDDNANTQSVSEFEMTSVSAMYAVALTRYMINASATWMLTDYAQNNIDTRVSGPLFSLSKTFFKRISAGVTYSNRITRKDNAKTNRTTTIGFNSDFRLHKKHKLGFRYTYNDQQSFVTSVNSFNDKRGDINYAFTF
jgi:hypothetical protein